MKQESLFEVGKISISEFLEAKQREVGVMAKKIAEQEFEILELNLFISSMGKEKLDEATNYVKEIKDMNREGKIDWQEYEELAEEV